MKLETLKDLYIHELKDLYSAEKQIIKALPKMVKAATDEQLATGFQEHFEQTKEHVARLEKILTSHDESTRGPKCEGMESAALPIELTVQSAFSQVNANEACIFVRTESVADSVA